MLSSSSTSSPHTFPAAESQGNHDTILAMLTDIKASNQVLAERITKIERQSLEPHPNTNQGTQFQSQNMGSSRIVGNTSAAPHLHYSAGSIQGVQDLYPTAGNTTAHTTNEHPGSNHHTQVSMGSGLNDSTTLPNLETIRRLPRVSEAVLNILASYGSQNNQESTLGKPHHRSGRYNNYDTVSASPEVRWPNEGFHGSNGKKTFAI